MYKMAKKVAILAIVLLHESLRAFSASVWQDPLSALIGPLSDPNNQPRETKHPIILSKWLIWSLMTH